MLMTIAAQDVAVGDEVYNPHASHPAFAWNRIRTIHPRKVAVYLEGGSNTEIDGFEFDCGFYTFSKIRNEGVSIRRDAFQ